MISFREGGTDFGAPAHLCRDRGECDGRGGAEVAEGIRGARLGLGRA